MKIIKSVLLIGCLSVSPTAFADQAAEKEAEKLLNTMGMQSAFEETIAQMLNLELHQNPALAPYKSVMMTFFEKHMSYDSLKSELVAMYAEAFTASELEQINGFYATEAGKKTIEKMPVLMVQGGQIGATRIQENIGELQRMIQAESARQQALQQQ